MATEIKLPRLGQGMESGTIVRWLKSEGEPVKKREPLYELDTDKVTQEVEADSDGVLLKIVVPEGEVSVGTTIAIVGAEGEDIAALLTASSNGGAAAATASASPVDTSLAAPEPSRGSERQPTATAVSTEPERVKASPLARRIARERGIDLRSIVGTGPEGRVVADDVEQAEAGVSSPATASPPAAVEIVELTATRKTIARRLSEAWSAPVFQLGVSADMTEMLALRESLVARMSEGDVKPTVNDILVKLVAAALVRHTAVNAHFTGDRIERHASANVGIAVAAPGGLVVPVIAGAERLTIREIAHVRADLVGRARDGKLKLAELQGGTFSISNLGMYGVEQFVAVLNPPQVAILAVGATTEQPVAVDGVIEVAPIVRMTLTCDHRAIDGADGAQFLQTLIALIEQPALAL